MATIFKIPVCFVVAVSVSTQLFAQTGRDILLKEFLNAKNDSVFINQHSARAYQKYSIERSFGLSVNSSLFDSLIFFKGKKGKIIGPLDFSDQIIYVKITSIDSAYRMRVGNIWLSPEKRGQDVVEKLAKEILDTIKRTGDFDVMKKYADDNMQTFEADLGWVFQEVMVPEFESEILKRKKGEVYVVTSRFGKHIVKTIESPVFDRKKVEYVLLFFDKK